jgi:hypothetical protein
MGTITASPITLKGVGWQKCIIASKSEMTESIIATHRAKFSRLQKKMR